MAALRNKEITSMKSEELQAKLEELRKELMKENTQIATGTAAKSPGQIKLIKKTIARIKTAMQNKKTKTKEA